jgi:hypothetical protein
MYDPKKKRPTFTTVQVAKLFFGRGDRWMYKYLLSFPKTEHPDIGTLELLRTETNRPARRWRLCDVELYAHLLGAHGVLNGTELARTVRMVKLSAEMWGYKL